MFKNIKDFFKIIVNYFDLYLFLAKQDINNRFRRSFFGIGWLAIQQLMFALFASIVWSRIFAIKSDEFIPFLIVGITVWGSILSAMVESCNIFINVKGYLKQFSLPYQVFILRFVITNLYYLFIGMLTSFLVLAYFNKFHLIGLLCAIPGLLILSVYFYAASSTMAYLGLRYRDIPHALTGLFSLLFIVTPVIFPPEILIQKGIGIIVYVNPFASLIEVIRYPIINGEFAGIGPYLISSSFSMFLFILQYIVSKKWRRLVPFWA